MRIFLSSLFLLLLAVVPVFAADFADRTAAATERVLAEPLVRTELMTELRRVAPASLADDLHTQMESLERAQRGLDAELVRDSDNIAALKTLYRELKSTQKKVQDMHTRLGTPPTPSAVGGSPASIVRPPLDPVTLTSLQTQLATLSAELAERDALLVELLAARGVTPPEGVLAASLLAIEAYPFASAGIVLIILALLFLFRGRIAEFSGFGVHIAFRQDASKKDGSHDHKD